MLNFDMIGNLRQNTAIIGGTSTGSGLREIAQAAAAAVPVEVRLQAGLSGGSDHLSFVRHRVPVMFCNTGLTDLYHTPEDDVETLNLPGTVKVIDYCEELLKGVVSMEKRPGFLQAQRRRRRPATYFGARTTTPDDAAVKGLQVQAVTAGSPAAEAGFKVGDVLQKLGGRQIDGLSDLLQLLTASKPGDVLKAQVLRDGKPVELTIKLAAPPTRGRGA